MPSSASIAPSAPSRSARISFPFFELPTEIRLRIYEFVLLAPAGRTLDLDPTNHRVILPRMSCLLACHRMYQEAYRIFYGSGQQPIRLYPIHGRFFHTKKPLLARIGARHRSVVTTVELRLGPGWSAPPKCWNTNESLGLRDCVSLRTLKIFIECDPSDDVFHGFRGRGNTKETYIIFCVDLLRGIVEQVPSLRAVELDAYPGVSKSAPLVMNLRHEIEAAGKKVLWGPLRGWEDAEERGGLIGLEKAMAAMGI